MKSTTKNYSILFEKIEEVKDKRKCEERDQFRIIKEVADEIALMKEFYSNVDEQKPTSFTRT